MGNEAQNFVTDVIGETWKGFIENLFAGTDGRRRGSSPSKALTAGLHVRINGLIFYFHRLLFSRAFPPLLNTCMHRSTEEKRAPMNRNL